MSPMRKTLLPLVAALTLTVALAFSAAALGTGQASAPPDRPVGMFGETPLPSAPVGVGKFG